MADDHGDDLQALKRVIAACRAQAAGLDMPALSHILARAETSLEAHRAPPRIPRHPALRAPQGRIARH